MPPSTYFDEPPTGLRGQVGVHRSGWAYVVAALRREMQPGPFDAPTAGLLLDDYIDSTFMDAPTAELAAAGTLPYRRPWLGIVHHTFDTQHAPNNCVALFESPLFLASLPACKAIIALSQYLATQLVDALAAAGFPDIPVRVLVHPTDRPPVDLRYKPIKLLTNPAPHIVQIGAWLRRPYAIYDLPVAAPRTRYNPVGLTKVVLRGVNMPDYFPPVDMPRLLETAIRTSIPTALDDGADVCGEDYHSDEEHGASSRDDDVPPPRISRMCRMCRMCRAPTDTDLLSPYWRGFVASAKARHESVEIIDHLNDEAYDLLLSRNIVFLCLEDASAVNTVIECIVRDTPLIVNRHPALEELLGAHYPGFYEDSDLATAGQMLTMDRIMLMYSYLTRVSKTPFAIETFLQGFRAILADINGAVSFQTTAPSPSVALGPKSDEVVEDAPVSAGIVIAPGSYHNRFARNMIMNRRLRRG